VTLFYSFSFPQFINGTHVNFMVLQSLIAGEAVSKQVAATDLVKYGFEDDLHFETCFLFYFIYLFFYLFIFVLVLVLA